RVLAIAIAPAVELAIEKVPRQRIGDASGDAGAKGRVGEKPRQQDERRVRCLDERRAGMAKDLLKAWTPHIRPDGAHAGNNPVGHDRAMIRCDVLEDVEAYRKSAIGKIEIADLVVARGWHKRERFFGEVAMRIDHEESVASRNVLRHDVEEERGLADAGRAENRHMAKPLLARERDGLAVRCLADVGVRIHSRDCLRGLRYGSWGNRLSACYAETNPDMDRGRLKRLRSPLLLYGVGKPDFIFRVWTCSRCDGSRRRSFGFGFPSRKDKSGSRLGTRV